MSSSVEGHCGDVLGSLKMVTPIASEYAPSARTADSPAWRAPWTSAMGLSPIIQE
nr:hypothetical protein [Microlunatus sp. Gsoil 973]